MSEHAVVIVGGGPAGMMLAAELALAKVDVAVVERLDTYHAERHPVAARALRYTMAQTALQRRDERSRPWSTWCRRWRAWTSLANGSPGSSPGWTSGTASATDIRCSGAACPIWT